MIQGPLQWAILTEKSTIKGGYLQRPDKPGFWPLRIIPNLLFIDRSVSDA